MIRLGIAGRIIGRRGLVGSAGTHLSVRLAHLADILGYLEQIGVRFYRAAGLVGADDFATVADCADQLGILAARLAASGTRLSLHLDHTIALGSDDEQLAADALAHIELAATLLEYLDAQRPAPVLEGTMVVHVGGPAADPGSLTRFAARYRALSARARARLVVEHDGAGFSLGQLLSLHCYSGTPIVFDALHWELWNPEDLPLDLALGLALATWPAHTRPEVHLSSPRSEAHLLPARAGHPAAVLPPRPGQHADFVDAAALQRLLSAARGLQPFDLMLEAKAGDLALLRLRSEIARRSPTLAERLA